MSNDSDYDHLFKLLTLISRNDILQPYEREQILGDAASRLQQTNTKTNEDYIAYLLDILEYAQDDSYVFAIEPLLQGPRPFLTQRALQVLCNSYNLTERYANQIIEFIRGVEWDPLDDLQHIATLIAGHYLRENSQPSLLYELVRTIEDPSTFSQRPRFPFLAIERQEFAYTALLEALGKSKCQTNVVSIDIIDSSVLLEAKRVLYKAGIHLPPYA